MTNEPDAPKVVLDLSRDSLSEQVYGHLRLELMSGLHAPGTKLSIRKLAASLDISATPVREAVFQLVREGALELRTGYQPRVPEIDVERYLQIRQTRIPLERLAGELAAARIAEDKLAELEAFHDRFQAGERDENWRAALIANQNFHFAIYTATQNDVLVRTIETLWLLAGPVVNAQYPAIRQASSAANPHLQIIDALRRRSPSEAGEQLVQDLMEGSNRILNHLRARDEARKGRKRDAV
ncbi:GntR family transcriptional regulator [Chachezhania sediminis]|uniref:GntR family transcriptional regulator n=1 Tax=Chachezhania sediminis TaxID=2599291 RepID=UPI00131BDCDC|nr:GntR family transcriptional regulator [Chachezhania sediminis]